LAARIKNPYQLQPISGIVLEQTVTRYNGFVEAAKDSDFGKPTPMYKIQTPPFYAALSTPILHDSVTGLKINRKCQFIDRHDQVIPGPVCVRRDSGRIRLARFASSHRVRPSGRTRSCRRSQFMTKSTI
jgi:hypothetical protein